MEQPLVSILIPFKDTQEFLDACLKSIIAQTYKNWQLIAVNDHSSDNSNLIVLKYCEKDSRIQVHTNEGHGIIAALRHAYLKSNGQLITRMDADDIMSPNKLEIMSKSLFEKGRGHVALGQVKYFAENGIKNGYKRYEQWLNKLTLTGSNYLEIYKECVIPSPCWMTFREDLDVCGAFDSDRYPEDYDLAFRFYEKGLQCIPSNDILHFWRDYLSRTSRTSPNYSQNYFLDIKLHYFFKLDRNPQRSLVVWGAGNKGKTIVKSLIAQQINFYWVCDNSNKIGKEIYGKQMLHFSFMAQLKHPQSIITVANKEAQQTINDFLQKLKHENMKDYFFFC